MVSPVAQDLVPLGYPPPNEAERAACRVVVVVVVVPFFANVPIGVFGTALPLPLGPPAHWDIFTGEGSVEDSTTVCELPAEPPPKVGLTGDGS